MADTKITQLQPPQSPYSVVPATDVLPIVVIADPGMAASGSTRKVTVNQILGSGGTATLASATITGDLTVRTAGLTVNANGVGVGVVGTLGAGNIQIGAGKYLGYSAASYIAPEDNIQGARIKSAGNVLLDPAVNCVFNIGGTPAMTLNATGLGVGAVPSIAKLELQSVTDTLSLINSTNTVQGNRAALFMAARNANGNVGNVSIEALSVNNQQNDLVFRTGSTTMNGFGTERMRIDTFGNVGIGVTSPAFKLSAAGVSQFYAESDGIYASGNLSPDLYTIGVNYYNAAGTEGVKVSTRPSWKIEHKNSSDALAYLDIGFRAASAAASAFTSRFKIDGSGNVISNVTGTAPTLATNSQMVFNLTSNTNLRISVRGTDGVTRTANITLA